MAENTPYGCLEEFSPEIETFASYSERVELFLQAHAVPDDRQVAVVLNAVGVKNYSLLRGLVAPARPSEKTVTELLDLLKGHYEPEPVIIAERYHFYTRNQKEEESVVQYAAELRRRASTCSFGDHLDDALRDRLVCGILSAGARKKLLAEKKLKFQGAVAIATNYETIEKDSRSIQQQHESGDAHKVTYKGKDIGDKPCYRCGRQGHTPSTCRFRNARCNNCSKLGHIAAVCRSNPGKKYNRSQGKTHKVDEQADETSGESEDDLGVFQIQSISSHSPPIMISLKLNGQTIEMELDTGASLSLISEEVKDKYLPHVPLQPTHIRLQTYTAQSIKVLGKCQVTVKYGVQEKSLVVIVVAGKRPCLFGRNWLKHIVLDWSSISHVSLAEKQKVDNVCSKYGAVFREETGIMKNFKAKLQLRKNAIPRFHRPRQVPFALKEAVGHELDRLEGCGILEKVKTSEWAAPIVAVPKKDGRIRVCGDYKVTINPSLDIDVYPLPNVDEMFAVMAGGEKFTKLDLTNAYQQMELDNFSRDLVTINTHQGLYRYTRLPFGAASAPAIFQRTMDTILQGLDKVVCYIDDILLTGVDDNDHLKTLEAVLQRLEQHGITLKKGKCTFLSKSVEFLGYRIDAQGLHTTPDKLGAILKAPYPTNVGELRSFLGLLNYYNRFIPNLASTLHPLHDLLRKHNKWLWTTACSYAVDEARHKLVSSDLLVHFTSSLPIKLDTDASAYGLGAVISHICKDGKERPIAFASRTLSKSERNYSQLEKEALAIIFGIKKFHKYLYGKHFVLVTDHKPLTTILSPGNAVPTLAAARLQRWALLLSAYSYSIGYRSTEQHGNADSLSRLPLPHCPKREFDVDTLFNIIHMSSLHSKLKAATLTDPKLSKIVEFIRTGWPQTVNEELTAYWRRRNELSVEVGCLLWGRRVIIRRNKYYWSYTQVTQEFVE